MDYFFPFARKGCLMAVLSALFPFACLDARAAPDPTLNGKVDILHCAYEASTLCTGDYCVVIPSRGKPSKDFWFSLKNKRSASVPTLDGPTATDIHINEASSVRNSFYVKYTIERNPSHPRNGAIIFVLNAAGQYNIIFGETQIVTPQPNDYPPTTRKTEGGVCITEHQ